MAGCCLATLIRLSNASRHWNSIRATQGSFNSGASTAFARCSSSLVSRTMQGSDLVYDTFLRPLVMQYEPDIEERFRNLRAKSGQLLIFYLKNFTEKGQILFLDVLRYVVSKASSGTEVMMYAYKVVVFVKPNVSLFLLQRIRGGGSSSKNKKREKQGADELEDIAEALFATNAKQRGSRQHK
ncbi:hypothetical protein B296_00041703 [Ensete ventricosum]|uniref:HVA22-like protein n=1 Tax=Ensete ventricosum TaxID=4639 RepID=A0A426XWP9_ENSVE|nr:hypothetical protein B296_00041703 [Ensete ventricosum]